MHACMHACILTYLLDTAYVYTHMSIISIYTHVYIYIYSLCKLLYRSLGVYVHICIDTYIHACIHTYRTGAASAVTAMGFAVTSLGKPTGQTKIRSSSSHNPGNNGLSKHGTFGRHTKPKRPNTTKAQNTPKKPIKV